MCCGCKTGEENYLSEAIAAWNRRADAQEGEE
jgi:hypothetical protein